MSQLNPRMTIVIAAPPATCESATAGKKKVMRSMSAVSSAMQMRRDVVVS
jgi:hypothetical protein